MNLLNKLTIKNLKLNKRRTIVTIVGIMLSVALITAVASIYSSLLKSLIAYDIKNTGNFHVEYMDVPISDIDTFKNNRKIEAIYLTNSIGYAKIDSKNEYKPYVYINGFTKDSLEKLSIKLVEGRLPNNDSEILIPTHLKTNGRVTINIGDVITLDVGSRVSDDGSLLNQNNAYTGNEDIINTSKMTYKVVGIIERPANNVESYIAPGYTFVTYQDDSKLTENVNVYARYTKDGLKSIYKTTANIIGVDENLFEKYNKSNLTEDELKTYYDQLNKAKYKISINQYLVSLETNPIEESGINGLGIVVLIVIMIIVFTSIFCIKNSFDISITEKIKQYGMLRSIGATKKQIRKNVFYEAFVLGLIGIPFGIFFGLLASAILIVVSNYFLAKSFTLGFELVFSFSYIAIIASIILGIITIYFSALRSSIKASKVSPIDSIRNSASIKINPKKIKSPKIIKKIFGVGGEISYKNFKRNKKKYRTTVISIIVSVAVFIALYSFMDLATKTIRLEVKDKEGNLLLTSYASDGFNGDEYNKLLATTKLDNVSDYTVGRIANLDISNIKYSKEYKAFLNIPDDLDVSNLTIIALGDNQYRKYIKSLGLNYDDVKNKAILNDYVNISKSDHGKNISRTLRVLDYNKNDILNVKCDSDICQFNDFSIEIGNVVKEKPFGYKHYSGEFLVISDEYFDYLFKTYYVEILYKSGNANKLQDDIDSMLKDNNSYYVDNYDENVRVIRNLYTLIGIFLYGFIIVISLIGATNIFNTITTNMQLRRQEFAMLKSIGMTKYEFNRMIRLESLFIGGKSLVFGTVIGTVLSYIIYIALGKDMGIDYSLPIVAYVIVILAVFVLISCIMKYSINKINKQNTIETIRNENI